MKERQPTDRVVVINHCDDGSKQRIETTVAELAAVVGPLLVLDPEPDDPEVAAAVEELLATGILAFEGDRPIEIEDVP